MPEGFASMAFTGRVPGTVLPVPFKASSYTSCNLMWKLLTSSPDGPTYNLFAVVSGISLLFIIYIKIITIFCF